MPETTTAPLTPMTPYEVMITFNYLRAVEAGDTETAAKIARAEPHMAALLLEIAQCVIVPATDLPNRVQGVEPCDDSVALFELGICLLGTLRSWHEQAGADAAAGIALAITRFIAQILTTNEEDVAEALHQMNAVALGQALEAHPGPAGARLARITAA
ncbi:hypothetical protein ACTVZO_41680 [Streptomyces sp. IBSNAI002]|uniref:hypothetical protein n=1 Tax=Streptomyces sp. IBSNAI002 TaxID=3457500 RepID=UPI003FD25ADE